MNISKFDLKKKDIAKSKSVLLNFKSILSGMTSLFDINNDTANLHSILKSRNLEL